MKTPRPGSRATADPRPPQYEEITAEEAKRRLLVELGRNRRVAHETLFAHRHPLRTPHFHLQMIDAFHGPHPKVILEAFRDAAKSTVSEEGMVVGALYREFRNCVIVGSSFARAKERLASIRNEFVVNRYINQLFGPMEGPVWGDGRIVLANGVCITALGAGMSMRGTKYLDARPDFWMIDDLEDEESVKTPEARNAMMQWLYRTFLPAMAKDARGRFLGNRLDQDAVIVRLSKDSAWRHYRFPIMAQTLEGAPCEGRTGLWTPTWADKFSIPEIEAKQAEYTRLGLLHAFNCEYMCEADDPGGRLFSADQLKTSAELVRSWEAVYAAWDPARTASRTSAMTGRAVFSWVRNRLVVWEGSAHLWLPDEIVEDILDTDERFSPVELGVEATGLEEFILQPLRHAALQRRQLLPIRKLTPPRGKVEFIRGLQPFFKAGEVEFVNVSQEAVNQLTAFPTGRKDFPNALAYALHMRPGLPVYDGFSRDHVAVEHPRIRAPWWLVVNATPQYTTAALLQTDDGIVRVAADWVREGPPGDHLQAIVGEARLQAGSGRPLKLVAPPLPAHHMDTVGLRIAARAAQLTVQNGGAPLKGRVALSERLNQRRKDDTMVAVAMAARWTLNGFAGGYALEVKRHGQLTREPVDNVYRVLMEGLESFVALMSMGAGEEDEPRRTAVAADGRVYTTIRAVPG
jgi:hypothetical protein